MTKLNWFNRNLNEVHSLKQQGRLPEAYSLALEMIELGRPKGSMVHLQKKRSPLDKRKSLL